MTVRRLLAIVFGTLAVVRRCGGVWLGVAAFGCGRILLRGGVAEVAHGTGQRAWLRCDT